MSLKCDFCDNDNITRSDINFIASTKGSVHICEECIQQSVDIIANIKKDKEFKQALEKTREKHADVIEQPARHD